MKYVLVFFSAVFCSTISAQYGASISYDYLNVNNDFNLSTDGESEIIPTTNFTLGVNYWFRLKNQRVEFFPEIVYRKSLTSNVLDAKINRTSVGFNFNTSVYVFDFLGDCNCPVFSKQNDFFKKGFFLELSPGVYYDMSSITDGTGVQFQEFLYLPENDNRISYKLGVGAGLDIGISDLITITPFFRYDFHFGDQWELLKLVSGESTLIDENRGGSHRFIRAGIRVGLRPDY